MKMNYIYLGWNNQREAYTLKGQPLVVLCHNSTFKVLEGAEAQQCKGQLQDLTHHLTGISKNSFARELLKSVEVHPHDIHAYNSIFDYFWPKELL